MSPWSKALDKPSSNLRGRHNTLSQDQGSYSNSILQQKSRKPKGTANTIVTASVALLLTLVCLTTFTQIFGIISSVTSLLLWTVIALLIWHLSGHHEHAKFGHANTVTTVRATSTAVLAGLIPIAAHIPPDAWSWAIACPATIILCLDGLDGYLARKNKSCSVFGARFDMETDAFLALVITLFLWQSDLFGIWVIGLGIMRYVFIGGSYWLPFLRADLYPSMRRKTVCVIQVGALCLMLYPFLTTSQATLVGVIALICLTYSFTTDVLWLFRRNYKTSTHK